MRDSDLLVFGIVVLAVGLFALVNGQYFGAVGIGMAGYLAMDYFNKDKDI